MHVFGEMYSANFLPIKAHNSREVTNEMFIQRSLCCSHGIRCLYVPCLCRETEDLPGLKETKDQREKLDGEELLDRPVIQDHPVPKATKDRPDHLDHLVIQDSLDRQVLPGLRDLSEQMEILYVCTTLVIVSY